MSPSSDKKGQLEVLHLILPSRVQNILIDGTKGRIALVRSFEIGPSGIDGRWFAKG